MRVIGQLPPSNKDSRKTSVNNPLTKLILVVLTVLMYAAIVAILLMPVLGVWWLYLRVVGAA